METYHLSDSEYRFMQVVWDAEPVGSGELVALCREKLGWKSANRAIAEHARALSIDIQKL